MILKPRRWKSNLLTVENAKTSKGEELGILTGILYLAPARSSGHNVCPAASEGCKSVCLNTAGRGRFAQVQEARLAKTLAYFNNRAAFMDDLRMSIRRIERLAAKRGFRAAVRLNGTSDIPFHASGIMDEFPNVIFYGYTKRLNLLDKSREDLTFSRSESNDAEVDVILATKPHVNIAVVFDTGKGKDLPAEWRGRKVIDADLHDARFLDPKGVICGLRAKGQAKKDTSGFVVKV